MYCCYPWEACSLLNRNGGEVDWGDREKVREELGGEEGRKTVVRM